MWVVYGFVLRASASVVGFFLPSSWTVQLQTASCTTSMLSGPSYSYTYYTLVSCNSRVFDVILLDVGTSTGRRAYAVGRRICLF